ncbi:MAG: hypothetical protein V5783_00185 [Pontiella sp.]
MPDQTIIIHIAHYQKDLRRDEYSINVEGLPVRDISPNYKTNNQGV